MKHTIFNEKGVKQFHLICTPIIWYLFLFGSTNRLVSSCFTTYMQWLFTVHTINFILETSNISPNYIKKVYRVPFGMYIHTLHGVCFYCLGDILKVGQQHLWLCHLHIVAVHCLTISSMKQAIFHQVRCMKTVSSNAITTIL